MSDTLNQALKNACRALLRPLALVLLRGGITWKEFAEISKSVFVSVATEEFGIRGRPTNVSRTSILTGISRKEVKRQRELLDAASEPASSKTTDATRLLSGWHQDPAYTDKEGKPLALKPDGPAPSFSSLFAAYGGDTPEQTLIRELKSAGSIDEDQDGNLVALKRYHMPKAMDEGNVRFFGTNLFDHGTTLSNNLAADGRPKWLEGFAVDSNVDARHVAAFREFIDERGQQLLEEIDDWLAEHRIDPGDAKASTVRLGLGVYGIEGPLPKGTST